MLDAFSRAVVTADSKTAPIGGAELAELKNSLLKATSALMQLTPSQAMQAAPFLMLLLG